MQDPELAVPVLSGLLHYWPLSNSAKEVLFLNELEQLLELTQPEEFALLVPPLFRRLAAAIASPHFQVAERALFLWHNEYISHLIAQHRDEILPILYPVLSAAAAPALSGIATAAAAAATAPAAATALPEDEGGGADGERGSLSAARLTEAAPPSVSASSSPSPSASSLPADGLRVCSAHWNPTVNNLTANVLKIFVELDAGLVEAVRQEGREREERRERQRAERRRHWSRLEEEAARYGHRPAETDAAPGALPAEAKEAEAALAAAAPVVIDSQRVDDLQLGVSPPAIAPGLLALSSTAASSSLASASSSVAASPSPPPSQAASASEAAAS